MCQVVVSTTIDGLGSYDMLSGFCQCLEGVGQSCCTGSYTKSCNTALQRSNSLFENVYCRVGQSAVNITGISQSETVCCVL